MKIYLTALDKELLPQIMAVKLNLPKLLTYQKPNCTLKKLDFASEMAPILIAYKSLRSQ